MPTRPHHRRPRPAPLARRGRPTIGTGLVAALAMMLVTVLVTVLVGVGSSGRRVAAAASVSTASDPTARPFGPVSVIGDSVLQGSLLFGPTIVDRLAEAGWGPIRARAGVGYTTGTSAASSATTATHWIARWRAEGWDAPNVLVNLGANDSVRCDRSVACARAAIVAVLDELGPGHRVWWPMITRTPSARAQADAWNAALVAIAAERDDVVTWDWPTVLATSGISSPDNTHLSGAGYRQRSVLMADELTAALARGRRVGPDAPLPAAGGPPSDVVLIGPTRAIDTRIDPPGRVSGGSAIEVDVADLVPDDAVSVVAYVSATNTGGDGFLTAYACGDDRPLASAANYRAGDTRGAVAITPLTDRRTFCLYTHADADLLVDVQAAFVPSGGLRFDPLDVPARLVDTRDTGRARILELAVPAQAASVSVTAVHPDEPGFLTVYPCTDAIPLVATVNHGVGELVSGTAFVPTSADGTICVYSHSSTDVTVDVTGTFGPDGSLAFRPATPTRQLDTRDGTGGWAPVHGAGQVVDVRVAPPDAVAVSGTLTMVTPMREGFQRVWGCGEPPPTANVTALRGAILANAVTTAVSDGRLCAYSHVAADTVFDTSGWWVPAP